MQNIRITFSKKGRAKYISHLDMTRLFQRAVRRAKINMWYTEGFHPHLYMTFSLPLSLGIESECESVDMKLSENMPFSEVLNRLNAVMPEGIEVSNVSLAEKKASEIVASEYEVIFRDSANLCPTFEDFLSKPQIMTMKKGKAGEKLVDIKPLVFDYTVKTENNCAALFLKLASGNEKTLNPQLLFDAFFAQTGIEKTPCEIVRKKIVCENGEYFA